MSWKPAEVSRANVSMGLRRFETSTSPTAGLSLRTELRVCDIERCSAPGRDACSAHREIGCVPVGLVRRRVRVRGRRVREARPAGMDCGLERGGGVGGEGVGAAGNQRSGSGNSHVDGNERVSKQVVVSLSVAKKANSFPPIQHPLCTGAPNPRAANPANRSANGISLQSYAT